MCTCYIETADLEVAPSVSIDAKPQKSDQFFLKSLNEHIRLKISFYFGIMSGSNVLFTVMLDYVALTETPCITEPSRIKPAYSNSNTVLVDKDKVNAFDQLNYLRHGFEKM